MAAIGGSRSSEDRGHMGAFGEHQGLRPTARGEPLAEAIAEYRSSRTPRIAKAGAANSDCRKGEGRSKGSSKLGECCVILGGWQCVGAGETRAQWEGTAQPQGNTVAAGKPHCVYLISSSSLQTFANDSSTSIAFFYRFRVY